MPEYAVFDYRDLIRNPVLIDKLNSVFILPRVVVFDVDDTLLDGDCSWTDGPSYKSGKKLTDGAISTCISTGSGYEIGLFKDSLAILRWLRYQQGFNLRHTDHQKALRAGVAPPSPLHTAAEDCPLFSPHTQVAYASRSDDPVWMRAILSQLRLPNESNGVPGPSLMKIADFAEIYPGEKNTHLRRIAAAAGCSLHELLFFDNEGRNIRTAEKLGVPSRYVPHGMNWANFVEGLVYYQNLALKRQGPDGDLARLLATTGVDDTIVEDTIIV